MNADCSLTERTAVFTVNPGLFQVPGMYQGCSDSHESCSNWPPDCDPSTLETEAGQSRVPGQPVCWGWRECRCLWKLLIWVFALEGHKP
jgi:hypothetical protein